MFLASSTLASQIFENRAAIDQLPGLFIESLFF